jgi:hypothetical protein
MRSPVSALKHEFDVPVAGIRGLQNARQAGQRRLHVGRVHTEEGKVVGRSVSPKRFELTRVNRWQSRLQLRLARAARWPPGSAEKMLQQAQIFSRLVTIPSDATAARAMRSF